MDWYDKEKWDEQYIKMCKKAEPFLKVIAWFNQMTAEDCSSYMEIDGYPYGV